MNDDDIDYSDVPPLNKEQLDEVVRIVRERKKVSVTSAKISLALPDNFAIY
jgi:hypothetical protein